MNWGRAVSCYIKRKWTSLMEYVRYNEVSLYRGSFPYILLLRGQIISPFILTRTSFIGSSLYRGSTVSVERREASSKHQIGPEILFSGLHYYWLICRTYFGSKHLRKVDLESNGSMNTPLHGHKGVTCVMGFLNCSQSFLMDKDEGDKTNG